MGLCGENGAGKSTLLKVLAGVHGFGSYSGDVIVGGRIQKLYRPIDARGVGIAVVHQELMLVPELTVAQNLLLGREPRRFGLVDEVQLESSARADLASIRLRRSNRRDEARRGARHRPAADSGDRSSLVARCEDPGARRAHRRTHGPRGAPAPRLAEVATRERNHLHLRVAPSGRGVRDLRPRHRPARRAHRRHLDHQRGDPVACGR